MLELVDKAVLETVAFMLESSSLSLGTTIAPLAQLVRALSLHGRCRWFESIKVYIMGAESRSDTAARL